MEQSEKLPQKCHRVGNLLGGIGREGESRCVMVAQIDNRLGDKVEERIGGRARIVARGCRKGDVDGCSLGQ